MIFTIKRFPIKLYAELILTFKVPKQKISHLLHIYLCRENNSLRRNVVVECCFFLNTNKKRKFFFKDLHVYILYQTVLIVYEYSNIFNIIFNTYFQAVSRMFEPHSETGSFLFNTVIGKF